MSAAHLQATLLDQLRRVHFGPISELLGARFIAADAVGPTVTCQFGPSESLRNGTGVFQGGAVCAMLDFAALAAGLVATNFAARLPTLEFSTRLHRPATAGPFTGTGRLILESGRDVVLASVLLDRAGEKLAEATATARRIAYDILQASQAGD